MDSGEDSIQGTHNVAGDRRCIFANPRGSEGGSAIWMDLFIVISATRRLLIFPGKGQVRLGLIPIVQ